MISKVEVRVSRRAMSFQAWMRANRRVWKATR